ncbi:hypothetical protein [Methylomonas albis]|uniref:Uncharacterized protein n=1 Tax=Methylomonas albis TaxID=1854563 RepID=A0ABR9D468_9GAMM|nr:hypothetical protein [Methylomonas albis]MBD9357870.1 hypothetical protein [Methylomonas albis]CAD6881203.1 hypothetical protein [Methylomonas albis]
MNPFDSVIVILAGEALAFLTLLVIVLFFISRNRRGREMADIDRFITELEEQAIVKNRWLEQFLEENCGLEAAEIEPLLQEVNASERALFEGVIRLFLKRELALLSEIEQRVGRLTEPYQNLLANRGAIAPAATTQESPQASQLAGMERINQQLVRQLDNAMKTIDEMSAEYTRVFSGNQTALELENSSKKMLQIFYDAERGVREGMTEPGK